MVRSFTEGNCSGQEKSLPDVDVWVSYAVAVDSSRIQTLDPGVHNFTCTLAHVLLLITRVADMCFSSVIGIFQINDKHLSFIGKAVIGGESIEDAFGVDATVV